MYNIFDGEINVSLITILNRRTYFISERRTPDVHSSISSHTCTNYTTFSKETHCSAEATLKWWLKDETVVIDIRYGSYRYHKDRVSSYRATWSAVKRSYTWLRQATRGSE